MEMQLEKSRVLTRVSVDNYSFSLTREAMGGERCYVLWMKEERSMDSFQALGRFSTFDKRKTLDFIVRYVSSDALREELARRRFARHLDSLSADYFKDLCDSLEGLSDDEKVIAFRDLFVLDSEIDAPVDLSWKRRYMAKRFHPDKGGDHEKMALINEGYRILKGAVSFSPA